MAPLMAERFPDYRFVPVDLERGLPDTGLRYDCVVCADVVEHLLEPGALIASLRECVAASGRLYISTPERDALRGAGCTSSPHEEHVREWSKDEFGRFLARSGLEIVEHVALPPRRVSGLERALAPALSLVWAARYRGCQLAVCERG